MESLKQSLKIAALTLAILGVVGGAAYGGFVIYQWFDIRFNTLLQALAYSIQVKCM